MPLYDYYCPSNDRTVEVSHDSDECLYIWGQLCYAAQINIGDTPADAPIKRVLTRAPAISTKESNAELKNLGLTKLVKRDDGVYENVTALHEEKRYMKRGDASSMPHIRKKVGD